MELTDAEMNIIYDKFEQDCQELTDAEMNIIYDKFEQDCQELKDVAFHNANQARYARNNQLHPIARDLLSHQPWKEMKESDTM